MSERDSELVARIGELRAQREAIILAHNYQIAEVQDVADFVGDSLELSIKAAAVRDAKVIVFCSVDFMAETAKLLSPERTVLLPERKAGCPMADMVTAEELRAWKREHPGVPVVTYVNSSAAVKAESDICCTSANAVAVVESVAGDEVLFVPDRCLGAWVQRHTRKKVTLWPGFCPTHNRISPEDIRGAREAHPAAEVLAHPECPGPVLDLADHVLSTAGMLRAATESAAREFIVATEEGLLHRLRKENPGKTFFELPRPAVCPNMKKTTLESVLWSLEDMRYELTIPDDVAPRARAAIERMLAVAAREVRGPEQVEHA